MASHGTTRYRRGCRCDVCKNAMRVYMARYRDRVMRGMMPQERLVPAKRVWDAVRALQVEHITRTDISRRLGFEPRPLRLGKRQVTAVMAVKVLKLASTLLEETPRPRTGTRPRRDA